MKGFSEPLRRCPQQHGVRSVFKIDTTLRSHLVRPKDPVDPRKQDGVVYKIPCECGKAYIGETGSWMHEQIKEHDRDMQLSRTQTLDVFNTIAWWRPALRHRNVTINTFKNGETNNLWLFCRKSIYPKLFCLDVSRFALWQTTLHNTAYQSCF